jgi:hypothetical protein
VDLVLHNSHSGRKFTALSFTTREGGAGEKEELGRRRRWGEGGAGEGEKRM